MGRPPLSDWETVFGFSEDPTPGDPEVLEQLASEYRSVARDAGDAQSVVSRLDSNDLGEGKSMEELRNKLAELPKQVRKLHDSYEIAADAVANYATRLRDGQEQAQRALEKGREAKERLTAATAAAAAAGAHVQSLDNAEAPPPDDKAARRSAQHAMENAKQAEDDAARSVESAESALEAARKLAMDAAELRTSDASVAKRDLEDAKDEAVEGKSFWDKIGDILNMVFSIIGAIVGIIAMFVAGPAGLILAVVSIGFGALSLGLTVGKSIDTGDVDVAGIVLGGLGLFAGGAGVVRGFTGALKGGQAGLGTWSKAHWANIFKPKPLPSSDIPLTNIGPGTIGRIPRKPVPVSANPFLNKPLPPPPLPPRPFNFNKPLPDIPSGAVPPIAPWDFALDLVGAGTAIGGLIYSPMGFAGAAPGGVKET